MPNTYDLSSSYSLPKLSGRLAVLSMPINAQTQQTFAPNKHSLLNQWHNG